MKVYVVQNKEKDVVIVCDTKAKARQYINEMAEKYHQAEFQITEHKVQREFTAPLRLVDFR